MDKACQCSDYSPEQKTDWFLRAYDAEGGKVGSSECEEGRIFIEPQGFCVMAEIGKEDGLAEKALDSVQKHGQDQSDRYHQPE